MAFQVYFPFKNNHINFRRAPPRWLQFPTSTPRLAHCCGLHRTHRTPSLPPLWWLEPSPSQKVPCTVRGSGQCCGFCFTRYVYSKHDSEKTYFFLVYILFEIAWLITGTVWVIGVDVEQCDKTIHIFSVVVIVNFWIHILTPLLFKFMTLFN